MTVERRIIAVTHTSDAHYLTWSRTLYDHLS